MTLIGYARVSTNEQKVDLQVDALRKEGCTKIFIDIGESGAKKNRPEWDKCRASLLRGDKLVIYKLDRIGRSLRNLLEIIDDFKTRGIQIKSMSDNIDTTTSMGQLMFNIMGSFAEYERELIRERVVAGLDAAKLRGARLGAPNKITPTDIEVLRYYLEEEGMSIDDAASLANISRSMAYRIAKQKYFKRKKED